LLLVTVRRQHADSVLDAVAASRARRIMFVFNAASGLARWRDAVGAERFSWGFPAAIARIEAGGLVYSIVPSWLRVFQITTIGGLADIETPVIGELAALFAEAGIPCVARADMRPWLETHAAFMMPIIASGILAGASPTGRLSWRHAAAAARAMRDAFHRVRGAGSRVTPRAMALVSHVPACAIAIALWIAFRFARARASVGGEHARGEVDTILDDLTQLAPGGTELDRLRALL
jgi:2-dehydropantoate 2-reductase